MSFKTPLILWSIPLILALIFFLRHRQKGIYFRFPSLQLLSSLPVTWKIRFKGIPFVLRVLVLILFILALAGPRSVIEETIYKTEGIAIILSVDSSGSMAAEDFVLKGNRITH